jgi:hypothetical protein
MLPGSEVGLFSVHPHPVFCQFFIRKASKLIDFVEWNSYYTTDNFIVFV